MSSHPGGNDREPAGLGSAGSSSSGNRSIPGPTAEPSEHFFRLSGLLHRGTRAMLREDLLSGSWVASETRPAAAGDEAVEQAVREYGRLVYSVAYAVLRNPQDAEDAAQEAFLRVLRLKRDLEGVRSPRTWLARIAFRVALDRRPRTLTVSLDDDGTVESLRDPSAGVDELAASRQVQALLEREIAALPAGLRHAVQLSALEELSSSEIANVLGIPEGTVRTRLMRARRLLRDALSAALGRSHD